MLPALAASIIACSGGDGPSQPAVPTQLAFVVQPSTVPTGEAITPALLIAVQDASGHTVTTATNSITIAIGTNPAGGTLSGTTPVSAVSGVATFSNLSIDQAGAEYTLLARASGLTAATSAPFAVTLFSVLATGTYHTCGLRSQGVAYCWGANVWGQLGDGSNTDRTTPVAVAGGLTFASLTTGAGEGLHACGLTSSGGAYCWGFNHQGELGDGSTTDRVTPGAVVGGLTFASLTKGAFHNCGLTSGGTAYCWGWNLMGQLGDGSTTDRTGPVLVAGGLTFASLTAGTYHTCGLTGSGVAYCWGWNFQGQLGDGSTTDRTTPGTVAGGLTFGSLTAGAFHTCGRTSSGAAYCWGRNSEGELADSSTIDRTTPVAVAGGLTFAGLTAGTYHTCGLTTRGAAYCWGWNWDGQLGDGSTTERAMPGAVVGGVTFAHLTAGGHHTCGLTSAGEPYCWGRNVEGQLGDGTTTNRLAPRAVLVP